MATVIQRSFSSGEISPSLYARVDLTKYATGLRTCKNNIVLRYGGTANRAGSIFVSEVKDSSLAVALIEFIFNDSQTYILEFGDEYIRVIKDGVLLKEAAKTISGATQADPCVITATSHGYSNGDEVYIDSVVGMTELNNRQFKIANVTTHTFEIQDMGGTDIDSTGYTAYSSAGTSEKIYELVSPYPSTEVGDLRFVQSADIISLVHPNHAPRELSRTGDTSWSLALTEFNPTVGRPNSLAGTKGASGSNSYTYKVTAIDIETGEESLPGLLSATKVISGATAANPCVITSTSHGYADFDEVYIKDIVGMTELNGITAIIENVTTNTYELRGIDSTLYTAYLSGGTSQLTPIKITSAAAPSTGAPHVISWFAVSGAREYNIYKETNGAYGQIGVAEGTSFNDINITPNTTYTPPVFKNPFIGSGNFPSTVTYIQQRKGYANTDNDPEKIWLSRTGNFNNFTNSSPIQSDDSMAFNMAGREVNEVRDMIDLGRLVILTSGGEWSAAGNEAGVIEPTSINTKQYSYNGSGSLAPIIIDGAAIYQQSRGSIIRDLSYDFNVDGYAGNDLTIFSAHLFDKYTLVDWAFQQIPHSILWVVRSDGKLLGLTFVRSQQVLAWHIHDLGGNVQNVAVVPEGNEDVVYVVVSRVIDGSVKRYIEKIDTRQVVDIVDSKFMDANFTYDGRHTASDTMTLSGGTTWAYDEDITLTSSTGYFLSTDIGDEIHLVDSSGEIIRAKITAYTSSTIVTIRPNRTVPSTLQSIAATSWSRAKSVISGLWHLEGEEVSIFADGVVYASPNNASYTSVTVAGGKVTLDRPYAVVHIGIPYISDLETLNIDSNQGETLSDKKINISTVNMFIEETRGVWAGSKPPTSDTVDPLEGLTELKIREDEDYDDPVELKTQTVEINIRPEWNSNGRVFIRQVDPIPMSILSVSPAGKIPFK